MNIKKYIDESVKLELNISNLYRLFSMTIEEDEHFWWTLSLEEINHASLLKSGLQYASINIFPEEILSTDIDDMIKINSMFESIIVDFKNNPSRKKAFDIAIQLEESAGESHYQKVMTEESNNKIVEIFKKLNQDDINHLIRLKEYLHKNNIVI